MQEPQETWVQSLSWKGPLEKGITLQYSCLENPMDRGAWRATVHGVAQSDTTEQLTLTHTLITEVCNRGFTLGGRVLLSFSSLISLNFGSVPYKTCFFSFKIDSVFLEHVWRWKSLSLPSEMEILWLPSALRINHWDGRSKTFLNGVNVSGTVAPRPTKIFTICIIA